MEILDVFDDLLQSRENGEAAVVGIVAVKHVERDRLGHSVVGKIASRHGQLVKVHDHADIARVELRHCINPSL